MTLHIETAREMMTHPVFSVAPDDDIFTAAEQLIARHVHGAPVIDSDGALVGVVSETDLTRVIAAAAFHRLPTGPVADHMTRAVLTVNADDDIYRISGIFERGQVSRLPVLEGGKVVGIITRRNLFAALRRLAKAHDRDSTRTYDLLAKLLGRTNPA